MENIMEFIKEYHGFIGFVLVIIGSLLMFNSLCNTKIEMYEAKIELEKTRKPSPFTEDEADIVIDLSKGETFYKDSIDNKH